MLEVACYGRPGSKAYLYKCLSDFAYAEGDYRVAADRAVSYIAYADSLYRHTQLRKKLQRFRSTMIMKC